MKPYHATEWQCVAVLMCHKISKIALISIEKIEMDGLVISCKKIAQG